MSSLKILGIDFSALFRRCWEASGGNELSEAHKRTLRTVAEIRDGFDRVALLCDGGMSFRRAIYPEYKSNRERPPAPFYEQRDRTLDRLTREGCSLFDAPCVTVDTPDGPVGGEYYAEADDLCASLAAWCERNGHALTLYGSDKDLLQLVDTSRPDAEGSVVAWRPGVNHPDSGKEGTWIESAVYAKYGVYPHQIVDWLALGGDASDGFKMFPGWDDGPEECRRSKLHEDPATRAACPKCHGTGTVSGKKPGIGPDIAAKLLGKFGTILGVIDAIEGKDTDGLPLMKDGHIKEVLRRGKPTPRDAAMLGLQLATLRRDLPVDFDVLLEMPVYAPLTETPSAAMPPSHPTTLGNAWVGETRPNAETLATAMASESVKMRGSATAMVRAEQSTGIDRYGLQPRSLDDMLRLSQWLYESRLYGQYPTEQAILAVMLEAHERGVPAGLALRNGYIVKGRPAWSAQFIGALVLASGKAKRFRIIESTTERAVLEYQRTDDEAPREFVFTIQEAEKAGWLRSGDKGDGKWLTNPRTMLRWAAIREGARAFFFDVVAGMYTPDELRGHVTDDDLRDES